MSHKIFFENVDSATAAAQEVLILDTLDWQTLDLSTFSLNEVSFGSSNKVRIPWGLKAHSSLVDYVQPTT